MNTDALVQRLFFCMGADTNMLYVKHESAPCGPVQESVLW